VSLPTGDEAFAQLVTAEHEVNNLWDIAKAAHMDESHVEIIRNAVGSLKSIHQKWNKERQRWGAND
jgi:hypothetical protein